MTPAAQGQIAVAPWVPSVSPPLLNYSLTLLLQSPSDNGHLLRSVGGRSGRAIWEGDLTGG